MKSITIPRHEGNLTEIFIPRPLDIGEYFDILADKMDAAGLEVNQDYGLLVGTGPANVTVILDGDIHICMSATDYAGRKWINKHLKLFK